MLAKRKLGKSNLEISALGLGCWQFSKGSGVVGKYWSEIDDEQIKDIIRISLAGGINWFDTAEAYGRGESEKVLARVLNELDPQEEHALIATKWWPVLRRATSITSSIEERLACLNSRTIHLYQIHQPYSFSSIKKQMKAMAELVQQGKIVTVGVSNFNAKQMREAHQVLAEYDIPLVSNQMKYSLLDRVIEQNGVLETAKELGVTIIAYSPLEQGLLTGKFHKNPELLQSTSRVRQFTNRKKHNNLSQTKPLVDLLEQIADQYRASASQVALNWLITHNGDTVVAIPGATKVQHAKDNVGALTFQLTPDEQDQIERVSKQVVNN
ncbi:aldo/keto reductase [Hazenella sp. IB182353]|uniref:aldo/keto reductase n=1 Tax=Polycladospora coralii TaxID=2771432 RepID=UPI001746C3C0|nr:aldo/keto reductase [Polycladospora coralii]MBS7529050.1 aldo/keto reductase [Polycladospora coralii]